MTDAVPSPGVRHGGDQTPEVTHRVEVAVNLLWCVPGQVGGSEQYLVRQLLGLDAQPSEFALTLYGPAPFVDAHPEVTSRFPTVAAAIDGSNRSRRVVAEHTWLARRTRAADVVHHGGGTVPRFGGRPVVLTIHDLQWLTYPQYVASTKLRYLRAVVPRSVRAADVVTVPTDYVRSTVVERLGADPARVVVVPHGIEPTLGDDAPPPGELRARYGLGDGPVLVMPAITHPHKGHRFLLDVMADAWRDPDLRLVLLGGVGSAEDAVRADIARLGLADRVVRTGRVPDRHRDGLIALADALVFPSEYEGFGAPVVEAMALGTPVVCSDRTALPEVVGDAGLVLPLDRDAWRPALDEIAARRPTMVVAGRRRAAAFGIDAAGVALAEAYGLAAHHREGAGGSPDREGRSARRGARRVARTPVRRAASSAVDSQCRSVGAAPGRRAHVTMPRPGNAGPNGASLWAVAPRGGVRATGVGPAGGRRRWTQSWGRTESVGVVVLCPHFAPDSAPTGTVMTRIVEELAALGHRVHVVTSLPWYRLHAIEDGWTGRPVRHEPTEWGSITRIHPFPGPDKSNLARRAVGFAAYSALAGFQGLRTAGWFRRADAVIAMSPPLTLGLTGWLVARTRRAPLVFNIQDVFPDAAVESGAITNRWIIATASVLERLTYRVADAVTVLSDELADNVRAKLPERRAPDVHVIPNFVDTDAIRPSDRLTRHRADLDLGERPVVLYAGNVGFSQSLQLMVAAAEALTEVEFLVNGNGAARRSLEDAGRHLDNLHFADYLAPERLAELLATGDVHVVPLKAGLGRVSVPSKTYSIMAAGRPVVAAIDPDTAVPRMLAESGGGISVPPDDPVAFIEALQTLLDDPGRAAGYGRGGRAWVEANASPAAVGAAYHDLLSRLGELGSGRA